MSEQDARETAGRQEFTRMIREHLTAEEIEAFCDVLEPIAAQQRAQRVRHEPPDIGPDVPGGGAV